MSYTLNNILSSTSINSNVGYNNSWVEVSNNADRPLFAQASYITNLDDLTVTLNTPNVDIGHVKLQDADSELKANVVTVGPGVGGLVVSVANSVTAVNATISNPVSSFSLVNQLTAVTVSNPVTAVSIINPVTTVNATITEEAGSLFAFNNHATANHHGWFMDDVMRPMISIQNSSTNTADIIKIVEYQLANNNSSQSTVMYEWYEGPLTLSGAAVPSWVTTGNHIQYRVYQDLTNSNTGNTFTVPSGTYLRHCGMVVGKNTDGDAAPVDLYGGSSRNMLTLCVKRLDNGTELDVWFAFTCKELA